MSKKDAGCAVAGIIQSNPSLLHRLRSLGYQSGKVGYTVPMVEILDNYFKNQNTTQTS